MLAILITTVLLGITTSISGQNAVPEWRDHVLSYKGDLSFEQAVAEPHKLEGALFLERVRLTIKAYKSLNRMIIEGVGDEKTRKSSERIAGRLLSGLQHHGMKPRLDALMRDPITFHEAYEWRVFIVTARVGGSAEAWPVPPYPLFRDWDPRQNDGAEIPSGGETPSVNRQLNALAAAVRSSGGGDVEVVPGLTAGTQQVIGYSESNVYYLRGDSLVRVPAALLQSVGLLAQQSGTSLPEGAAVRITRSLDADGNVDSSARTTALRQLAGLRKVATASEDEWRAISAEIHPQDLEQVLRMASDFGIHLELSAKDRRLLDKRQLELTLATLDSSIEKRVSTSGELANPVWAPYHLWVADPTETEITLVYLENNDEVQKQVKDVSIDFLNGVVEFDLEQSGPFLQRFRLSTDSLDQLTDVTARIEQRGSGLP